MKKTVFLMLCASMCFSFLATSCDKKDEKPAKTEQEGCVGGDPAPDYDFTVFRGDVFSIFSQLSSFNSQLFYPLHTFIRKEFARFYHFVDFVEIRFLIFSLAQNRISSHYYIYFLISFTASVCFFSLLS